MYEKTRSTRQRLMALAITLVMMLSVAIPALADEGYTNEGIYSSEVVVGDNITEENIGQAVNDGNKYTNQVITDSNKYTVSNNVVEEQVFTDDTIVNEENNDNMGNDYLEETETEEYVTDEYVVAYAPQSPTAPMATLIDINQLSATVDSISVTVEGNPSTFTVGDVHTFVITANPDTIDLYGEDIRVVWELWDGDTRIFYGLTGIGLSHHGYRFDGVNVVKQGISFTLPGTFELIMWMQDRTASSPTRNQMTITVHPRQQISTTPTYTPVYTPSYTEPVRSGGGSSPSSQPGGSSFNLNSGMGASTRVVANIRNTVSNATTAESILSSIQAVLPDGVTARWGTHNSQFRLVPATETTEGRVTGIIIVTSGTGSNQTSTAINLNITIPILGE